MLDIIKDTLIDGARILPFLYVAFLIMELVEHKLTSKNKRLIQKSGKFGPIVGSILGAFPQCGFSATMTNLYAGRIITIGTLISIYLSTSDEMMPILLSEGVDLSVVLKILGVKVIIGMLVGFIVDYFYRKTENNIKDFCDDENCHCGGNLFLSSLKHTINILLFIMGISFLLNVVIYYLGEDQIAKIFLNGSIFGPFVSSLVGLIPNCAASVVITELYLSGAITFGSMIAGLLTGSGVALMILFKVNKNLKENINILLIIYFVGVLAGIVLDLLKFTI